MTTAYTPKLQLALPVTGELDGTWGNTVNDSITSLIEEAIAGVATINSWTGASHTLTVANGLTSEARCAMLVLSGTPGAAATVIAPATSKIYIVQNTVAGGYAATVKVSGQTGIVVPNGSTMLLYCDGTDIVSGLVAPSFAGITVTGTAVLPSSTSIGTITSTELSYLDGVTSALQTQLDAKANLASPALTGTPTAPTQTVGDATTKIATTAFVAATAFTSVLPGQTGNAGKLITTDGTNASWTPVKTVNSNSLLGTGDLPVQEVLVSGTTIRTVNGTSLLGSGNIIVSGGSVIRETATATASQTVFNLTNSYTVGLNSIIIYINGVRQFDSAYTETSSTVVTFTTGLNAGDVVLFEIGVVTTGTALAASSVTYNPTIYMSATDVQTAITELAARPVMPDFVLMNLGVY